ncbi:hypothetical protein HII31_02105 [Pseudocercospora fuligena]|uniref:Uncharacterized protein n=1 Tax=Pseudocercospora fuligena TaxID=685502 RepID=A0A8H6VM11_9PEZI|nr:hypothetical protein HII31_02105 [Pseudocercospora fuligena]
MRIFNFIAPGMAVALSRSAELSTASSTVASSSTSSYSPSTPTSITSPSTPLSNSSQPTTLATSVNNSAIDTVMSTVVEPVTTKIVDVTVVESPSTSVAPSTVTVISTVTANPSNTTTSQPTQTPSGICKLKYFDEGYKVEPYWRFEISGSDWSPQGVQYAAEQCGTVSDFDINPYNPVAPFNWTASGLSRKTSNMGGYDGGLACLQAQIEQAGAAANLQCDVERQVPEKAATCFTHYWTAYDKFNIQGTRAWSHEKVKYAAGKCGVVSAFDIVDYCDVEKPYADSDKCNYGWSWRAAGHLGVWWDLHAACLTKHLKKYTDMPGEAQCGRWDIPQGIGRWTDTESGDP